MSTITGVVFSSQLCGHCGCYHAVGACPRVKAIEYFPDGTVKRVEYHQGAPQVLGKREPLCPICGREWDTWERCTYGGCHDGRLPKPKPQPTTQGQRKTDGNDE